MTMKLLTKITIIAFLLLGTIVSVTINRKGKYGMDGGNGTNVDHKNSIVEKDISKYLHFPIKSIGVNINMRVDQKTNKIHEHGSLILLLDEGEVIQLHVLTEDNSDKFYLELKFVDRKYYDFTTIKFIPIKSCIWVNEQNYFTFV